MKTRPIETHIGTTASGIKLYCFDCMLLGQVIGLPCEKRATPGERAERERIVAAQLSAMATKVA